MNELVELKKGMTLLKDRCNSLYKITKFDKRYESGIDEVGRFYYQMTIKRIEDDNVYFQGIYAIYTPYELPCGFSFHKRYKTELYKVLNE